jgi:hypothetical protein
VQRKPPLLDDHRVPSVGPAVPANHEVSVAREQIDDFAFALVPPLAAHDRRYGHGY